MAEPAPTSAAALATITRVLQGETVTDRTSRVLWRNALRTAASVALVLGAVIGVAAFLARHPSMASAAPFVGWAMLVGAFFGSLGAAGAVYAVQLSATGFRIVGIAGVLVAWADVAAVRGSTVVFSRRRSIFIDLPFDGMWPQARECLAVVSFLVDRARHGSAAGVPGR